MPFLRSCGDISAGFPAAAFSGRSIVCIDAVNFSAIALNISILVILSALTMRMFRRRGPGRSVSSGIKAVVLYNLFSAAGYLFVHPLYIYFSGVVTEYIAGIYLYFLYPVYALTELEFLENAARESILYGDVYDLKFRAYYLIMTAVWFCAGFFCSKFISGKKEAGL